MRRGAVAEINTWTASYTYGAVPAERSATA